MPAVGRAPYAIGQGRVLAFGEQALELALVCERDGSAGVGGTSCGLNLEPLRIARARLARFKRAVAHAVTVCRGSVAPGGQPYGAQALRDVAHILGARRY